MLVFRKMELKDVIAKICEQSPAAKLVDPQLLEAWAQYIIDGTHTSYLEPPKELVQPLDNYGDLEFDNIAQMGDDDDDFGDIVTVKDNKFVVCTGLVIPLKLLHEKVLPMVNEEMKALDVTADDIFNALMTE